MTDDRGRDRWAFMHPRAAGDDHPERIRLALRGFLLPVQDRGQGRLEDIFHIRFGKTVRLRFASAKSDALKREPLKLGLIPGGVFGAIDNLQRRALFGRCGRGVTRINRAGGRASEHDADKTQR